MIIPHRVMFTHKNNSVISFQCAVVVPGNHGKENDCQLSISEGDSLLSRIMLDSSFNCCNMTWTWSSSATIMMMLPDPNPSC